MHTLLRREATANLMFGLEIAKDDAHLRGELRHAPVQPALVEQLRELFIEIDTDGSGSISVEELRASISENADPTSAQRSSAPTSLSRRFFLLIPFSGLSQSVPDATPSPLLAM